MSIRKPVPTWEQPRRSVLRHWREHNNDLFELECGHVEPKNGYARPDLVEHLACQQCRPVKAGAPMPGWE